MSDELIQYLLRIAVPAFALIFFLFTIPKEIKLLRIFLFMLLFVLLRDAMTPTGIWKITPTLELRFIDQPTTLWLLAISSISLVILSYFAVGPIGSWSKKSLGESIIIGLVAGVIISLLPYFFGQWSIRTPSDNPKGAVLLIAIAGLAFLGNTLEEVIFRGHFQNYLNELKLTNGRIVLLSGGMFSVCHSFLAFTVTNVGWAILVFTFYEGIICAYLRQRNGLLSAVVAHGVGLFLILSGNIG